MNRLSTINAFPTFHYEQPIEYRFSHDSVFLARFVFERLRMKNLKPLYGLDLCSGCGVVGLDFLFHCENEKVQAPSQFDFLEWQEVYKTFFISNCQKLSFINTDIQFVHQSFTCLSQPGFFQKYDLILSNPPYFEPGLGRLSPSHFKNYCRFFIEGTFDDLVKGIEASLSPKGEAFLLIRPLEQHKIDLVKRAREQLTPNCQIAIIGDIRGTQIAHIQKSES